jgi:uncharacterized protein
VPALTTVTDEALNAFNTLGARAVNLVDPSIRLGVTGLSRSGKTVFITALVNALIGNAKLPLLSVQREGRLKGATLGHQPDDTIPRFQYEEHLQAILKAREWPNSTKALSELRVTLHYASASGWNRTFGPGRFSIDIIDYPGEWLLDLPLLGQSYKEFSDKSFQLSRGNGREAIAADWHKALEGFDILAPFDDVQAEYLAQRFTAYLLAAKQDENALSSLPPGRFLMPGDLAGSPALTFAPLENLPDTRPQGSFAAIFERRFEAYKSKIVRPFFREHILRLDRQIVLVDALTAMNAGPDALADLERALADILACFRPGLPNVLASLVLRRIDRILIAATKADHVHHTSHGALIAAVRRIVDNAVRRASLSNAAVDIAAISAMRATREGTASHQGKRGQTEDLPVLIGVPKAGEIIAGQMFDGETETAIFPGDLPEDTAELFEPRSAGAEPLLRFVKFRPPHLKPSKGGIAIDIPHIRLDKALEFLIGDKVL